MWIADVETPENWALVCTQIKPTWCLLAHGSVALNSCQAQLFPAVNAGKDIYAFSQIIVDSWRRCRTSFQVRAGPVISIKTGSSSVCLWCVWDFSCALLASLPSTVGKNLRQCVHPVVWMGPGDHTEWIPSSEGRYDHTSRRCVWKAGVSFLQSYGQRKRCGDLFYFIFFAQKHYIYNCNSFVAGAHPNSTTMAGFVYEGWLSPTSL